MGLLKSALDAVRVESARIAAIAQWLRENGASSANASLPNAGPIVIYSDGSYKLNGAARVILGVN